MTALLLALAWTLGQTAATAQEDAAAARRHDALGIVAGDAGRIDEALREFETAVRLDPTYAPAHVHLGLAFERTGRERQALGAYQQALRINPDLLEARYGLSSVCAKIGDLDGAIALLRPLVVALPDLGEAHYNLGLNLWNRHRRSMGLRKTEDLDEALDHLKAAVRLWSTRADFHAALGQLLADRQQIQAALESLGRAVELEPRSAEYAYDLGLALRLAGDFEGAEAQFRRVLERVPAHGLAHRALGLVLRQRSDLNGAASALRAATAVLPTDAQAHHLLGSVLLKLVREGALEALERSVALDPHSTEARATLAQALVRAGRKEDALREQAEVARINAENAGVGRAMILLETAAGAIRAGDRSRAVEHLRNAVTSSPLFPEAHYQLGLALRPPDGDGAASEAQFARVVELDPNHAAAHHQLGALRARRGDSAGAVAALRRATELAPGLVAAHRDLAAQAWQVKDWPTVMASLESVVAWEPGDAMAHYALARALGEQGDRGGAARELAIARRLNPSLRMPP